MTTLAISATSAAFDSNYHIIDAKPAGKATFKSFRIGVPKIYFDAHPVSPAWAQEAIIKLSLDAIRVQGIAARNANASEFDIPDRLPEFLESLATSGRLLKTDLEAWTKANSLLFTSFLTDVRKHASDDKLPGKVRVLAELVEKGAAPTPPWSDNEQVLLGALFAYLAEKVEDANANDTILVRLLAKLDSLQSKKASLADAL
jgi:hypothetical protein